MSNTHGTYFDDSISISFSANVVPDYIGDPSVPNGTKSIEAIEDIEIDTLSILEINITKAELALFPTKLQEALQALHEEVEWEVDALDDDGDYAYDLANDK